MLRWQPIKTAPKDGSHIILAMIPATARTAWHASLGYWNGDQWEEVGTGLTAQWCTHWTHQPGPPNKR